MKRVKIALLTELFYPHMAGCERRFFEIGRRLVQRGHEVHVFTLRHDADLPKEEIVEGIFVHRCAYSSRYITPNGLRSLSGVLKYSLATSARLFAQDFDVYYSNQWPIVHSFFARPFASPFVQEWCEVWTHSSKIMMLQEVLKRVGIHHVAVSQFTKDRLVHFLGIDPQKVSVVPNGVNYLKLSAGSHKKKLRRIVYVGRLTPHKHVEMVVEVFRLVKKEFSDAELHIIGSGPSMASIKDQASSIDDCFIHGFLPENEMLPIVRKSSLFLFPSEREGSGIVALEAMAAGIPVITADFPDNATKEVVNGTNGLITSPSVRAMVRATQMVFGNKTNWYNMSEYARCFAKQYDWDSISVTIEEVLKKVVAQD